MKTTFKSNRATYRLAGILICLSGIDDAEVDKFRQSLPTTGSTFTVRSRSSNKNDGESQTVIAIFENNLIEIDNLKQLIRYKFRMFFTAALSYIGINTVKIVVKY